MEPGAPAASLESSPSPDVKCEPAHSSADGDTCLSVTDKAGEVPLPIPADLLQPSASPSPLGSSPQAEASTSRHGDPSARGPPTRAQWALARAVSQAWVRVEGLEARIEALVSSLTPELPDPAVLPLATQASLAATHARRQSEVVSTQCRRALAGVMAHKWCWPFLSPVDEAQYPDYRARVPHPMDFGTIKRRCDAGEYLSSDALLADVALVFDNARLYNSPGSDVHVMANTLQERFNDRVSVLVAPRLAELAALQVRDLEAARRACVAAVAAQRARGAAPDIQRLHRELAVESGVLRELLAEAAARCPPVGAAERAAFAAGTESAEQGAFDAAVDCIARRVPECIGTGGGVAFDVDALDCVTLRQAVVLLKEGSKARALALAPGTGKRPRRGARIAAEGV